MLPNMMLTLLVIFDRRWDRFPITASHTRWRALGHGVARTTGARFDLVQQSPCPDKLPAQHGQSDSDHDDARTREHQHRHADDQQRKAENDLNEPPGFLKCGNSHSQAP